MSQTRIRLIGAPTDVGASMRGASMAPEALRVAGAMAPCVLWMDEIEKGIAAAVDYH